MSVLSYPFRKSAVVTLSLLVSLGTIAGCGGETPTPKADTKETAPAAAPAPTKTGKKGGTLRPEKYQDEDSSARLHRKNAQAK